MKYCSKCKKRKKLERVFGITYEQFYYTCDCEYRIDVSKLVHKNNKNRLSDSNNEKKMED